MVASRWILFQSVIFIFSIQLSSCAWQGRILGNTMRFVTLSNGNTSRLHEFYAGMLRPNQTYDDNSAACLVYCGMRGFKYGVIDPTTTDFDCFCGDADLVTCSANCNGILDSSGVTPAIVTMDDNCELFTNSPLTESSLTNVGAYGVHVNGRVSFFPPDVSLFIALAEIGSVNVSLEVNSFWGARSPPKTVNVYAKAIGHISCPLGVEKGTNFECVFYTASGSDLTSLQISGDGTIVQDVTDVADPMLFQVGGNMKPDRFTPYEESYDRANTRLKAFINLNHEFAADSYLAAFEAYITYKPNPTGCIEFMILKPTCSAGFVYCNSLKKCIAETESWCGQDYMTFNAPSDAGVFCSDAERFTSASDYKCPSLSTQTAPEADYTVVLHTKQCTSNTGNTVFKLAEPVFVKAGYVLGWKSDLESPVDVGHYPIDLSFEESRPEYVYNEVYNIELGSVLSHAYPLGACAQNMHMVRAYAFAPSAYIHNFTGTAVGNLMAVGLNIASVHSSDSKTVQVQMLDIISGLQASLDKSDLYANEVVTLSLSVSLGSEFLRYFIHWNDAEFNGTYHETFVNEPTATLSHAYPHSGTYKVHVLAQNHISSEEKYVIVTVRGVIDSIRVFDPVHLIFPVPTNTPQIVDVIANGAGLAELNFTSTEDDQTVHPFHFEVSLSNYFVLHTEYTYDRHQDVLTVVSVTHPLNENTRTAAYGSVEDVITELVLDAYQPISTATPFVFAVLDHIGTNVTYRWTWNDTNVAFSNGTYDLRTMEHQWVEYGNYTCELHAWNQVSNHTISFFVIIQDLVVGLAFTADSMDTEFEEETHISFQVELGTGVNISIDYNYASVSSPQALDMDVMNYTLYGQGSYTYPERGQYNVCVTAENSVNKEVIHRLVSIQSGIVNFNFTVEQDQEGTLLLDYLEQGEVIVINTTIDAGDDVVYYYDAGDGREVIATPNTTINITYPRWRTDPPYTLRVTAANLISNFSVEIPVAVEMPVQELVGFSIINDVENSTEQMLMQLVIEGGDFFNCTWNMSDGSAEVLVGYNTFLSANGTILHQFAAGIYNVTLFCFNRLFTITTDTLAYSYDPVTLFDIDLYRACPDESFMEGVGDFMNIFPIECPVMFALTNQLGTNVSYEFDYGYFDKEGKPVQSIEHLQNETHHQFEFTTDGTNVQRYKVGIRAFSAVNEVFREVQIELIESILNVTLGFAEEPVRVGSLGNFTVSIKGRPYKPCYSLDFGDKEDREARGITYKTMLFGHPECTTKPEYKFHVYLKGFEDTEDGVVYPLLSYLYPDIKVYDAVLEMSNLVSSVTVNFPAKIRDQPCDPPELQWDSAIANTWDKAEEKSPFFKCRRYVVLTKARKNCIKLNTTIDRLWSLRRVLWVNETQSFTTLEQIEIPGNDTRYVIEPRKLNYGLYHIQFNASMYDELSTRTVLETDSTMDGFFVIKQCDLLAKITGGTGKAVPKNGTIFINATQSTDPDREPGTDMGLVFEWFCKQNNAGGDEDRLESFPEDLSTAKKVIYPSEPDIATTNKSLDRYHFKGCFGTGYGLLSDTGQSNALLELNTDFMLYSQLYNLWLKVSQPGREKYELVKYDLKVVFGVPPLVGIECKLNCEKKQNPTEKTSFVAKCTNCNGVVPIYSWQMFAKLESAAIDDPYKDETELLRKSASVNIDRSKNLVINPNTFVLGKMYIVKLLVYWDEDSYDTGGFSQYSIVINSPPKPGPYAGCFPNEMKGKALETKFQLVCDDIDDVDKPLTYYWYYLPGNSTSDWRQATFPRQGLALSEQFTLSAGDPVNKDKVQLKVVVTDLFGAGMDPIFLEIVVEPKELDNAAIDAMLGDENAMSDPAVMGNVMNGLLDSMKTSPADDKAKKKSAVDPAALKTKMVSMLANVKIDSPSGCSMVAGTLNGASDPGEEMSDEALEKSLKASGNVAGFTAELSPADLAEIAKSTLSATSKFTSILGGDNAADNIQAAMDSEAQLTSGAAANMVAGENSAPMVTANGVTKVLCVDPKDKSADLGGFKLPDSMGGDDDDSDCSGATNPVGKNRFGFSKSAGAVHGGTQGLGLSSGPGKKKKVENLTEPIRLVLPNKEVIPPPESHLAYCELMRVVHLVECKVNASNLFMKMKPWFNNFTGNLFVFMNKGVSPSLVDHQHNCTLPNPYPDNFVNMTKAQRYHFEHEEKWRCFINQSAMNETCTGRWCVGVIYYTNTTNHTEVLKPRDYPVEEAKCPKLNYTFYAYTRACLYWDTKAKAFSGKGCKASAETKDNETVCYCNHLTDFGGGGPLAEPNPIDFGAALSGFSNIGDNPTVFSLVIALIGLYFIGMLWARWMDKKDVIKNAMYPLEDNHPNDTMFYEISVETGHNSGSTTTSEVFITLHGTLGETSPRKLHNPERQCFTKSGVDNFLFAVPYSLGDLKEIEIWHNNTGESPGWFHIQTIVRDTESMKKYTFFSNQWFDVGEEDGLICRKVEKASKGDLKDFNFVFAQTARQNLYDGHIWFSIFTRPAASLFTRCQRVSTCFSLLLTTMLANAMFYKGDDAPPGFTIQLGPIKVSIDMIKVGITSSLVVVPANLLIILLFKKAGPKKENISNEEDNVLSEELASAPTAPISSSGIALDEKSNANFNNLEAAVEEEEDGVTKHNRRINFLKSLCFAGKEDDEDEELQKKKKPLPHWLIYIAYFVVFITSSVSAFFVILYGFSFGKPKSDKWTVAMMISFAQSVFLIQPTKVVLLSVVFALMVKDPSRGDDDDLMMRPRNKKPRDSDAEDSELEEEVENITKKKKKNDEFKMPDQRKLEEARMARLAEKRIKAIIKEIIVHLVFLTLCLMVAYAAADPNSFALSETTKTLCMKNGIVDSYFNGLTYAENNERTVKAAADVTTRLEWLDWARYSVVEYLFPIGWYNGDKDYLRGFTADTEASKVLAMARFRQLRVKPMSCQKHPVFEHLVEQCNAGYSWGVEETVHYSPGWEPELNKTMRYRERRGKRKALYLGLETPWRYGNSTELQAFPFVGKHATYSGSSYAVSIGPNKRIAKKILESMKDNFWVDRYTRAIITEANIYNANTNLMLIVTFLHEILPTGGWSFYYNIQSLRLYRYVGGLGDMIMLFDIIYVIVTLVGLYKIVKHSRKQGFKNYISNPWNLLHFVVTFCSIGATVCTLARFLFVKWSVENYTSEPELFTSFAYVAQLEYLIMGFIGFVVFFTNLEFLRILRFNRRVGLLTKTIGILGKPMASFGVLFIIVFMAYVGFCHCIYVDKLFGYSSMMLSFISLTEMFLGSFDIFELIDQAPFFGPIMFFSYMLLIQMVLINMFIGIICDAFAAVREASDEEEEANVMSFMNNRMKNMAGGNAGPLAPIYSEWKTDWEVMMEEFDNQCDNCIYAMRNIESEEIRNNKWFEKADEKKKNMLAGVLGMEYFLYETEVLDALQVFDRKTKRMTAEDSEGFLTAAAKKRNEEKNEEPMSDFDEESSEDEDDSEESESGNESE